MKLEITVAPTHVKAGEHVAYNGAGFTPDRTAMSHLERPDGSEFNQLRLRVDKNGAFSHRIDTVALDSGTFVLWAEDEASKMESNRVRFTVE